MKPVILYFTDAVNLKAFVLVENVRMVQINEEQSLLHGALTETQILKACAIYGAAVQD